LSNGIKIDFEAHETPRIKRLQKKIARTRKDPGTGKGSGSLLRKEHEKLNNRRRDAQNKILTFLRLYGKVVFQDDYIKGWTAHFSKATPQGQAA